jgi:hypothetical protein
MSFKDRLMGVLVLPAVWIVKNDIANERIEQDQFNQRMQNYEKWKLSQTRRK